jgi:ketosteroid isomerase-like protein
MPMTARDVADAFAALCKAGKHEEAGDRFWAEDIVSREAMEGPMAEMRGRAAVKGKGEWWYSNHEIHSAVTEGPYVHGDQFALTFKLDVTEKASGRRMQMTEIGLYTVANGKVVEERFFY